jgi:hypothetical protein
MSERPPGERRRVSFGSAVRDLVRSFWSMATVLRTVADEAKERDQKLAELEARLGAVEARLGAASAYGNDHR